MQEAQKKEENTILFGRIGCAFSIQEFISFYLCRRLVSYVTTPLLQIELETHIDALCLLPKGEWVVGTEEGVRRGQEIVENRCQM